MIAVCLIRDLPAFRRDAFEQGLKTAGYSLAPQGSRPSGPDDFLVIWNRQGAYQAQAEAWERDGGTVLVCENGYAGKDDQSRQYYAISASGHNGSGWFPVGSENRFAKLRIDLQPWRTDGAHVLVCGQRGIGSREMASPPNWHIAIGAALRKHTRRTIRLREHPGRHEPKVPLDDDLRGCWACCIWSSAAGIRALVQGVPVFYAAPHWICAEAASRHMLCIDSPLYSDDSRLAALRFMAWGQRSVAEIETGEVFVRFRESRIRCQ